MFQLTLLEKDEEIIKTLPREKVKKVTKIKNKLAAVYSSNSDDWATDPALFDKLNNLFNFNTDLSASFDNFKCNNYFFSLDFALIPCLRPAWIKACGGIIAHSSLVATWAGSCWLNPPYSNIEVWAEKSYKSKASICFLIPARTDTRYFKNYCHKARYIVYLYGRQKFGKGRAAGKGSAPFPSCLVLFGTNKLTDKQINILSVLGQVTENLQPVKKPVKHIITKAKDLK